MWPRAGAARKRREGLRRQNWKLDSKIENVFEKCQVPLLDRPLSFVVPPSSSSSSSCLLPPRFHDALPYTSLAPSIHLGRLPHPMKIILKIFVWRASSRVQHSFLVNNDQGGLTSGVGSVAVNEISTTLEELRSLIEVKKDRGMCRRTLLFEEVLYVLSSAPNPHDYPLDVFSTSYQFGVVNMAPKSAADSEKAQEHGEDLLWVPEVIPVDRERELKVGEILPPAGAGELPTVVIIPVSQIGPTCQRCCRGCDVCAAGTVDLGKRHELPGKLQAVHDSASSR